MYNEYSKYYFRVKKVEGIKRFYFRFNNDNIEDSEETFRIYKRSQDRIQYNMRKEATRSIIYYENIDEVAFLFIEKYKDKDIVNNLFINDLIKVICQEIICLELEDSFTDKKR